MLDQAVQYLKGVGPNRAKALNRLDIHTIKDLLYHFPRDYQDRSQAKRIAQSIHGQINTITAKIVDKQEIRARSGIKIGKLVVSDGFSFASVLWFNQTHILKKYSVGEKVLITGKVEKKMGEIQFSNAEVEIEDGRELDKILPIYSSTEGLSQKIWRTIIKNAIGYALNDLPDVLPDFLKEKYKLLSLNNALRNIHFPDTMELKDQARRRLAFEEVFLFQLALVIRRKGLSKSCNGIKHQVEGELFQKLIDSLPFPLTGAQERVIREIKRDMESSQPMNRLVQGDVGAGKTIVAAGALACCLQSGYQGVMMAPTEILAEQHFRNLSAIFSPLGKRVSLLTGSLSKKEKSLLLEEISQNKVDLIIGTHALIQDEVSFGNLGLCITDEQHRFGVMQRATLQSKGLNPDTLIMTATPIPRTLSLTLYGDLDISIIDELPPGRQPVKTHWVPCSLRDKVYEFIRDKISQGRQAYIVCPLVEESEKLDLQAATDLALSLQEEIFLHLKIGLLHGKMKSKEKEEIMEEFRQGSIDLLVSTTVIEVGVDIPNATVMVIENCERFGLAQLHQLRGRVGRGSYESFCVLIGDISSAEGRMRVDIMTKTNDGFKIAEEDLKIRGPGEFLGLRQHGFPSFKLADLVEDYRMLETARKEAFLLLEEKSGLNSYPDLRQSIESKYDLIEGAIN